MGTIQCRRNSPVCTFIFHTFNSHRSLLPYQPPAWIPIGANFFKFQFAITLLFLKIEGHGMAIVICFFYYLTKYNNTFGKYFLLLFVAYFLVTWFPSPSCVLDCTLILVVSYKIYDGKHVPSRNQRTRWLFSPGTLSRPFNSYCISPHTV